MAGSAAPGVLYGEVSAGWTPDAPVALVLFHGYGANEQDLAPLGPMLAPACPGQRCVPRSGWLPAAMRGSRPSRLATGIRARATDAAWQWIDAHMAPDATVAAVGFSQDGLMAT
jgi:phospholipase/carboxylesterase